MVPYRQEQAPAPAALPTLDELARTPAPQLRAPAAQLRALVGEISRAGVADIERKASLLGSFVFGGGVIFTLAACTGIARFVLPEGVMLFVFACALGTVYGVTQIVAARVRFVSKRTGEDVTFLMPLALGLGYGLLAWGVEAALALLPLPSIASALVLGAALFGLWRERYRPEGRFRDVPYLGITDVLLQSARSDAEAELAWAPATALPADRLRYRASVTQPDGVHVVCSAFVEGDRDALVAEAQFPPGFRWRHGSPSVVVDGLQLTVTEGERGPSVRATAATGKACLQAISLVSRACAPPA